MNENAEVLVELDGYYTELVIAKNILSIKLIGSLEDDLQPYIMRFIDHKGKNDFYYLSENSLRDLKRQMEKLGINIEANSE